MAKVIKVSDSFTRPANTTAYGANDLVANSATAGSVVPLKLVIGKGGFKIKAIQILKTDATDVANADFDIHMWTTETVPVSAAGDNAAFSKASVPVDGYLGFADCPTMTAASDDASTELYVGDTGYATEIVGYAGANGTIFALLQVDGAYTPASAEVFTVKLVVEKTEANS